MSIRGVFLIVFACAVLPGLLRPAGRPGDAPGTKTFPRLPTDTVIPSPTVPVAYLSHLPLLLRDHPPKPTPTITLTPTSTRTSTHTATRTITGTPTWTATVTPTFTPIPNTLRITALHYAGNDEYVEITNFGPASQAMTGWRIQSVVGDQWFNFPADFGLPTGGFVRVHSGPEAFHSLPQHLLWTTGYIWNNAGDEARLFNEKGELVDRRSY